MGFFSRKTTRLAHYDYNTPGYYFLTLCTKGKQKLLCNIVGTGLPDGPKMNYSQYGIIAKKQIDAMANFYDQINVDKYVIMPNHIHLLIHILNPSKGPSGRPVPTNSMIGKFVGTFKRFRNRQYGKNIWQSRSHDHIIRGEQDYLKIWQYIDTNPAKWTEDCFYVE